MTRRSRTEFAVLGMLTQGPMSGYDLRNQFEERVAHFWCESSGQIYPTLARLAAAGLVTGKDKSRPHGPKRKEYRITTKGRKQLRSWMHDPVGKEQVRNELLLKMFFGPAADVETSIGHLEAFETLQMAMQRQFTHYQQRIEDEEVTELQKVYWRLTLRSGQLVNEARLKWCREAKKALSDHVAGNTRRTTPK